MSVSARLGLPLLASGQAEKEFFHNEALQALDILVAATVEEPPRSSPPTNPTVGSCYIVGGSPGAAWSGFEDHLAGYTSGGWRLIPPLEGMRALVRSTGLTARFHDGSWQMGTVAADMIVIAGQQVVGPRAASVPAPAGGSVVDVEARSTINAIVARLREHGLIA